MLKQLALLVQNKIALAAIGTALVAGGGAATVAVVHNNNAASQSQAAHATATAASAANAGSHAHTIAVEGTLKAYDAGGKTITVQPKDGSAAMTIAVNGDTKVNGAHANSLADLTKAVGSGVQVQATKQSDGSLLAWKITVQGTPQGTPGSGNGNGNGNGGSQNAQAVHGTVMSVDVSGSSFVLKLDDGSSVTVTVNASTTFDGRAHKLADLAKGMSVAVQGTKQSDGSIVASHVSAAVGSGHP